MMWSESNSLTEIQSIIEDIFKQKMHLYVKVCDIINLSYDEYIVLMNKLKAITSIESATRYSLSILVAWVNAYKFNKQDEFYNLIRDFVSRMPQHHTKFTLDALNNTCYDYQIHNYNIKLDSLQSIQKVIKIHAGYDVFI